MELTKDQLGMLHGEQGEAVAYARVSLCRSLDISLFSLWGCLMY
ncbi:hypothetical protein [Cloacibacillus porcorum]|nr:hypothetical protein [Cloacibacillus porcorum]